MKSIIFGLGNPGKEYDNTRHNFGRKCVEGFVQTNNLVWKTFNSHGEFAKWNINENEIYFLKTSTLYMNESGIFVKEVLDYFKVEVENVIIIYDELNFELGEVKLKLSGRAGGHNGMKDVIKYLNTMDVKRIRLGIGRPNYDIKDYVLAKFNEHQLKIVNEVVNKVKQIIDDFSNSFNFLKLMNKYNTL